MVKNRAARAFESASRDQGAAEFSALIALLGKSSTSVGLSMSERAEVERYLHRLYASGRERLADQMTVIATHVGARAVAETPILPAVPDDEVDAVVQDALNTSRRGRATMPTRSGPQLIVRRPGNMQKDLVLSSIVGAVARRLESVSEEDLTHIDPKQVAERAAALIPTPHPFTQLGPFYPTRAVTKWLGLSRQALDHRVKARKMLGCPTADGGQRVYPVWQFTTDGHTIPHLAEVLETLHHGIDDPWSWATWLAAPVPGRFDGNPAYQWLAEGRDAESVLTEARRTASRLAH